MTLTEVFSNIVAETLTKTWAVAPENLKTRLVARHLMEWGDLTEEQNALLTDYFFGGTGEPVAAKKVIKRKPRKAKAAPLTEHAAVAQPGYQRLLNED